MRVVEAVELEGDEKPECANCRWVVPDPDPEETNDQPQFDGAMAQQVERGEVLGSALHGFLITYAVKGKQYVAVPTGMGVFKLLTAKQSPEIYQPNGGNALYVFELPDDLTERSSATH